MYFHRGRGCASKPIFAAKPHWARLEPDAAAIPELSRPRLDWRDGNQLWLWSYTVTGLQLDEDGQPCHPELPDDYPDRRPKTFAYCESLGLGTVVPCAFATCRHNLLSDELRVEMHGDDPDPWAVETCALAVARRGRHSSLQLIKIMAHCESTVEEASRRSISAIKRKLDLVDFEWPPRIRKCKLDSEEDDGITELVVKMPERQPVTAPTVKILTKQQVAAIYGRKMVHPDYGKPTQPEAIDCGIDAIRPAAQPRHGSARSAGS